MKSVRVKAIGVPYRQGWIEVAQVHPGFINIETWDVHPDVDISAVSLDGIADRNVTANTEIELNVEEAKKLADALLKAIADASGQANQT
ncbi:hypothetical protein PV762_01210 [Mitsuaria sp. CC2]|uniref:hypothetical protein n=1 Tax=Mitsuaria sp. CC2 TaxID=3029186 RepID=UPI003B8C372D